MVAHHVDISLVHFVEIAHLLEINMNMYDMRQIRANGSKHRVERPKDLRGLRRDVFTCNFRGFRIDSTDAANRD